MEKVHGERKHMIGDVMNVWNQNVQTAKITRAVSLPAVPRRHWGTRRGTNKCLECERMENNSNWIYPPEGVVPPVPTLWVGACSVSQSRARKVWKLPIYLKRKYCDVQCKGDEVDVLGIQEVTCACQPPWPSTAVLCPAEAPGCVCSRENLC